MVTAWAKAPVLGWEPASDWARALGLGPAWAMASRRAAQAVAQAWVPGLGLAKAWAPGPGEWAQAGGSGLAVGRPPAGFAESRLAPARALAQG
ncbi:hypothetical protein CLI92_06495 [Vandammella animalimorsus]|uniref:Uncharacterized protein n=1 Tax=Vandammella animalimorsus TaxID=2029117 RepID=A0A2A2T5D4_9BURK|nr:hypothetical protein CLI92_06495 [Vandammella animalimorsus]PAX20439.1 hypothetical protein CLI93_01415 [Vandammella animalimorsus]